MPFPLPLREGGRIARGIPAAAILADGFAESGPDGAARQARLAVQARAGGLRLLGPNSMGVVNVPARIACSVNAVLEVETLPAGRWSLVSQSGSVMGTLLSRAAARGAGFAKLVSMGNEADLTAGEIVALPKGDLAALARAVAAFSRLAALADVAEAEINPLIVLPQGQGVAMADALLRTGTAS